MVGTWLSDVTVLTAVKNLLCYVINQPLGELREGVAEMAEWS